MISMSKIRAELSPEELARFERWFNGQTGAIDDNGECCVYDHDWERWLRQGKQTAQGRDWD